MNSRPDKTGFTLLEVILSIAIIAIIMIGLQQVLGNALTTYENANTKQDLMARAQFAMGRMVSFVEETNAIINPVSGSTEEFLKVAELKLDTYDNATHAYDADGDGILDADNDADGLVNEGGGDLSEYAMFWVDKTNAGNWRLFEAVPAYNTADLNDYAPSNIICEHVTLFQCIREGSMVEISLTLDDGDNRVSLKTSVTAGRWPEALPEGSFPQTYFYIADTDNHRIRKVDGLTGIIETVAGKSSKGYSGDDGSATNAKLDTPFGICSDGSGNFYIADTENHRIRMVDGGTGIITTVAGTGSGSYSGDGGQATSADLKKPRGVFVDGSGHLYIADTENHRIRMVDGGTGIITTVAGTGSGSYSGDGGQATSADIKKPGGVVVGESNNIYIADTENHRIRKVDVSSGIITTVAGTGNGSYSGDGGSATSADLKKPGGVGMDAAGNIYISDTENHRIRKVDASTGIITTVAGKGTEGYSNDGKSATSAKVAYPNNVWADANGNLFISDYKNHRIRKVDAVTGIIVTVAGKGSAGHSGDDWVATKAKVNGPKFVFVGTN